jgi:response regulator RpfG family c-di-GMP phosphodiesterase
MKILIVDDEPRNLDLFSHMLSQGADVATLTSADPHAALDWCAGNAVDLVLLDYMMPAMDGLAFLGRFRALPGRELVPVIMVTADDDRAVRHAALRQGATDFLTKPADRVELNARVGNLLALRRAQLELGGRAAWLAEEVRLATAALAAREREAIHRLSRTAEYRDPETGAHLLRMANYAWLTARALGLPLDECELIRDAAPMHDIGKVGIPDAILLKPGRLTAEEMVVMRRHAQIGADILADGETALLQAAAAIAASHHERYDGAGYPRGLAAAAIPLHGRIVAVADVFDALTSSRPYKSAWSLARAAAHLREGAGSHFDPVCVEALLRDWDAVRAVHQRYQDEANTATERKVA